MEEGRCEDVRWRIRHCPETSLNATAEVVPDAKVEPSLTDAVPGEKYQFERIGYFAVDPDSQPGALVFNRTVTLRSSWKKVAARM